MIYIHRKLGSFGAHCNRDGAQNRSSRGAASRRAFYATRLVTTSSSALPRNVPPTTSIPQARPYCRMLGRSKPSPSGEGFSVLNHSPGRNRGSSAVLPRGLFHTVEPRAASAGCLIELGSYEAALSTRILGLFYKAVSREVFVFSVVNRLLVRRLLRPALIAEQFCHVHL